MLGTHMGPFSLQQDEGRLGDFMMIGVLTPPHKIKKTGQKTQEKRESDPIRSAGEKRGWISVQVRPSSNSMQDHDGPIFQLRSPVSLPVVTGPTCELRLFGPKWKQRQA